MFDWLKRWWRKEIVGYCPEELAVCFDCNRTECGGCKELRR